MNNHFSLSTPQNRFLFSRGQPHSHRVNHPQTAETSLPIFKPATMLDVTPISVILPSRNTPMHT